MRVWRPLFRIAYFGSLVLIVCCVGGCHQHDAAAVLDPIPVADTQKLPARDRYDAPYGAPLLKVQPRSVGAPEKVDGSGQFIAEPTPRVPAATNASASGGVTLNLIDIPIQQAAKAVLGEILGASYLVDPAVNGRVTVATPRPVTKDVLLQIFEAALKGANAAIVDSGEVYKIVPLDQARTAGAPVRVMGRRPKEEGLGTRIEVAQLRFVSATDLKRLIEPMAPKSSIIQADNSRNILTLSGTTEDLAVIRDYIVMFDVDTMRGMSFEIVPVRSSDPDLLAEELRTVFAADKEGPMSGMIRFIGHKRLSSVLVISPQRRYLARAEFWIKKLDARASNGEKQFYTYRVQNRPARELVEILNAMFVSDGPTGQNSQANIAPRTQPVAVSTSDAPAPVVTPSQQGFSTFGPQPPRGPSAATTFGATGQPASASNQPTNFGLDTPNSQQRSLGGDSRVKFAADATKNALIIVATPEDYRRILTVIQGLDQLPNQVLIEAVIAEVTLTDEMKFGVRWTLQSHASQGVFSDVASGAIGSVFPGFSYLLTGAKSQFTLNALSAKTNVNVISSPSLTVLDNKTATLQVGDQVPITTQSAVNTIVTGAPVINSVSYRDTGVILSITPHINESGRVILDIEQEVSSVSQTTTSTIDSPTIQQRKVKTTVVLNDGEALTLGGLIQTKRTKTKEQLPILGDIPVIGTAFRSKDDVANKTELVIMIVPRVIRSLGEAHAISSEFRAKLERIGRPAMDFPTTREQQGRRILD